MPDETITLRDGTPVSIPPAPRSVLYDQLVAETALRREAERAIEALHEREVLWQAIAQSAELMERDRCGWQEVSHALNAARNAGLTWQKKT